mmetsp:Transcript_10686/g.15073  ORF Transcript_10686/g.15073 Transcript_10686/m.15073 type:complete len:195 (+) Transcript_10686:622-1206(+)
MIGAEVMLSNNGAELCTGKVISRVLDSNGNPVGEYNKDPLLDSRIYEVMFPDGEVQQYSSNLIAKAIWSECDSGGRRHQLMDEKISHEKGQDALEPEEAYKSINGRNKKFKKTTKGWRTLILKKDGQQSWVPMKDIKDTYPLALAEYAEKVGIHEEAAFWWWIPHVKRKKSQIIAAVNRRMIKKTHKFEVEVPS